LRSEIRLSIDVSMGLVFRDFRNDAKPGVKGAEVAGMVSFAIPVLWCTRSCTTQLGLEGF
jgi:hypothetical protein